MEIIERPYNISYSINHIRYVFLFTEPLQGLQLQVKILFTGSTQGTWQEVATWLLTPANDGKIYLYIEDLLHSELDYTLPSFNEADLYTHAQGQYGIFTIHYRKIENNSTTPGDYITTEEGFVNYVIKGGIEKHLHSRNNFFKYWELYKFFLTNQPGSRFIDPTQAAYLTFLNPNYFKPVLDQLFAVCVRVTDINGNIEEYQSPIAEQGLLFHLCIKMHDSIYSSFTTKQLYSLEIGVITNGDPYSYKYKFYFEQRPNYHYAYDLAFINSLGGMDSVRVKGDITESLERSTTEGFAGLSVYEPFEPLKTHEYFFTGMQVQKKYKGDIGYMRSKELQYSFADLLISPAIYMRNPLRWVPVLTLQKSQELGSKKDSLQKFPIEWELSEQNEVYTPDLALALGDDSRLAAPVVFCANVTGLTADIQSDMESNSFIHFAFTPVPAEATYTAMLIDKATQEITATLPLTWDLASATQEGSFPITVPPALYSLVITTICNPSPLNASSGASVDIELVALTCPAMTTDNYTFVMTTQTSVTIAITHFPTADPIVNPWGVGVQLYKVDPNGDQAINGNVLRPATPYQTFDNLEPGIYYCILSTLCDIGQAQPLTTNTVSLSGVYRVAARIDSNLHDVYFDVFDSNDMLVQAPFYTVVDLFLLTNNDGGQGMTQQTIPLQLYPGAVSPLIYFSNPSIVSAQITGVNPGSEGSFVYQY